MLIPGGGEMGRRIADHDWTTSPLGPIDGWSDALRGALGLMLPASAEIVLFWGPDYVALYNDAYSPTIGAKHPAALGQPASAHWAELWDDLEPLLRGVRETGESYSAKDRPFHIQRVDGGGGEDVWFDVSYSAVRERDGSVGGILCIVSETTARVRASRQLTSERERLAQMFDSAPGFMTLLRQPGHVFELVNAAYLRLVGERDLVGKPLAEALPEAVAQGFGALLDTVVATKQPHRGERVPLVVQREDGTQEERLLDFVYQPITDADGRVTAVFVEGTDVTERHAAETALWLSRESLALATEAAEIGTWDLDLTTDTLDWSARTKAMFGISPDVPCSMADFYAGLHHEDVASTVAAFQAALDPARRALYDTVYRTIGAEDGVVRWIAAKGRGVFDAGGRCIRALGTTLDISSQMQQAAELRESEARFRALADTAPALIWQTDVRGDVSFANGWFERLLGRSFEMMAREGWESILHPEDRPVVAERRAFVFEHRLPYGGELRVVARDGTVRWVHAEGRPRFVAGEFAGYVGCAVDVTESHLAAETLEQRIAERTAELTEQIAERERVEDTLRQMQRLEAVGQLTSGVAHDFNNLLTVVLGNVGMIERTARQAELDARTLQRLEHVRTAAERGAALTAQLLAFSRNQRLEAKVVDLNETVAGMQGLLDSTIGGGLTIVTRRAPGLWPALVDPTQIELIILNLAINARDAMPEADGTLTIATENVTRGPAERAEEPAAGDYVMVAVTDTGTGMSDAVLAKAFEPFFTTKEVGRGSGLGLAQVYGFAKQSGGGVRIDSREGEGTTVRVYLPRATQAAAVIAGGGVSAPDLPEIAGRTIMVLDDDDAVRAVTADGLRDAGCRVIEAADGAAALVALAAEPGIAAVVADFAMPGMNGAEFARRARLANPALPIVFVTGFADLTAIADVPVDRVIQKPYPQGAVAERLRVVLGA